MQKLSTSVTHVMSCHRVQPYLKLRKTSHKIYQQKMFLMPGMSGFDIMKSSLEKSGILSRAKQEVPAALTLYIQKVLLFSYL